MWWDPIESKPDWAEERTHIGAYLLSLWIKRARSITPAGGGYDGDVRWGTSAKGTASPDRTQACRFLCVGSRDHGITFILRGWEIAIWEGEVPIEVGSDSCLSMTYAPPMTYAPNAGTCQIKVVSGGP